jgi:hypothetical protein
MERVKGKDDVPMERPESPFELTMAQQLHLERLRRDVQKAHPDDLRQMIIDLASQLLVKSNIANALMRGKF